MKIAFLSPFYPYRGGIAQFSDSLYLGLTKNNEAKAFNFTRQYPGLLFPGKTQFADKGDVDRHISANRVLDSINPFSFYKTAREIIKYKPDVVLISYWMPFFAPAFGKIAKLLRKKGIKVTAILHNVIAHENRIGDKALTKYFFNNCDGFVILNKASEKDLLELKPDAKYIIHPHPLYDHYGNKIDKTEARKKLNIPSDKKVVLFFGFIRDYKGLDLLIESMKNLDDNYLLLIAGEVYGNFKKYDELIDKLGVRNKINLQVRYIPEAEIPLFFSASDVCVLPYRTATQSGIVGIAYHFDLPVIATNVGGLAEMVEDGKTGMVVENPTSEEISSAILQIFNNDIYKSMVPAITEYRKVHSWSSFADKIVKLAK
ncbi:MAG: glycosyltransferase [Ignavibacteria bacterium]|nr:glycosyltransferase [Ignavibacteria bacterium]MCC7158151.1 glycosyltransferase [Ignavibacteria bacterium]